MQTIKKATVAVCDILGFSDLVKSTPLQDLLNVDFAHFRRLLINSASQKIPAELPPTLEQIRSNNRVGVAWFSDTVVVYGKNDDDESYFNVLETVEWLLFRSIETRTKIRGAIAYGEFLADSENELFIGLPIVEAYELERVQEWFGAALAQSAVRRLPPDTYGWPLCKYEVPIKPNAKAESHCSVDYAVNWTRGFHAGFDLRWSREKEFPEERDRDKNSSLVANWENTRTFHDAVCTQCFRRRK